ncbi:MAG: hypothetical protein ACYCVZ_00490 [Streptosporangiaceae bacterium]
MPIIEFVSPERYWRAGSVVLVAVLLGWRAAAYAGPDRAAMSLLGGLIAVVTLGFVGPALRARFVATDAMLIDRRAFRTVRLAWDQVAEFEVRRPGGIWGGYCVVAECRNGRQVDFLATMAFSRAPSARHLDELHRLCWTLEDRLGQLGFGAGSEPAPD